MKLTVIPADKTVYEDGVSYSDLSLATIPSNIHALQFDTTANTGWIEFIDNADGTKSAPNEIITALPSWGNDAMTAWTTADTAAKAAAATAAAATAAENQPKTTGTTTIG